MNWGHLNENIIQWSQTIMMALFIVEVLARTLTLTLSEVRKAWARMRKDSDEA